MQSFFNAYHRIFYRLPWGARSSLLKVNFAHGALAEGGARHGVRLIGSAAQWWRCHNPVPQHNLWRAVRFAAALAITATGWCMAVRAPARTDTVSILSLTMAVLFAQVGFSKAGFRCFFLRRPRLNVFGAERNSRI